MNSYEQLKLAIYESGLDFEDACDVIDILETCDDDEFEDVIESVLELVEESKYVSPKSPTLNKHVSVNNGRGAYFSRTINEGIRKKLSDAEKEYAEGEFNIRNKGYQKLDVLNKKKFILGRSRKERDMNEKLSKLREKNREEYNTKRSCIKNEADKEFSQKQRKLYSSIKNKSPYRQVPLKDQEFIDQSGSDYMGKYKMNRER